MKRRGLSVECPSVRFNEMRRRLGRKRKRIGAAGSLIDHLPTREVIGVPPRNLDESKRLGSEKIKECLNV